MIDPSKENPEVHVYDGIVEENHPIPGWFRALFYGTILAGGIYFFYYGFGFGMNQADEYAKRRAADESLQLTAALKENAKLPSEEELRALLADSGKREVGAKLYEVRCVSCHGSKGEGGIGPNLADSYWIHGSKLTEIHAVIRNGVLDKGMPPWGSMLQPSEIVALVVHVRTLLGSNPAGAKAPQGALAPKE